MNSSIFTFSEPDRVGQLLNTGYNRFMSKQGCDGLAKENGDRLDILAVGSFVEGKGIFREFILDCQKHYRTICVWEIWNSFLPAALSRYGFTDQTEILGDGEILTGMRWDKP